VNIIRRSVCLSQLLLLAVILSACDNVFNRSLPAEFFGGNTNIKGCPDLKNLSLSRNRLVTEQKIHLSTNEQVVLKQEVAPQQDKIYLNFHGIDKGLEANNISLLICFVNKEFSSDKFLIPDTTISEFSSGENPKFSISTIPYEELIFVFSSMSKESLDFILDVSYTDEKLLKLSEVEIAQKKSQNIPSATGFLDMHLHQTGAMAFNQGWYWGSHEIGSLSERLPDCHGEHASMFEFEHLLDGKITGPIAYSIAPKRDIDDFMRSHRDVTLSKDYVRSNDRKHQQVAFERLKQAHDRGLNLIISTVVENNVLLDIMHSAEKGRMDWYPSVMASIQRQIISLKKIDEKSEWFEIVYDPWHARKAIAEGKLAVVLGAEFTDIFPPGDGPWKQQLHDLYALGLRHLQPVHKSDSQFSSTHNQGFPFDNTNLLRALIRKEIPNWPAIQRTFGQSDPEIGLSLSGFDLLDEMVHLNMIIDLSHASLSSQKQMTDYLLLDHNYYPFIYSHWRARSPELLNKLKKSGGMVPLGWGQPVPEVSSDLSYDEELDCRNFVKERANLYQRYIDYGINFSLASDMNGFTSTTQPNFGPSFCLLDENLMDRKDQTQTWENMKVTYPDHPDWVNRYWAQGTADISLLPGIVYDLREVLGLDTSALEASTEAFILMWERSYDKNRQPVM